jgi:hypothetical protein
VGLNVGDPMISTVSRNEEDTRVGLEYTWKGKSKEKQNLTFRSLNGMKTETHWAHKIL